MAVFRFSENWGGDWFSENPNDENLRILWKSLELLTLLIREEEEEKEGEVIDGGHVGIPHVLYWTRGGVNDEITHLRAVLPTWNDAILVIETRLCKRALADTYEIMDIVWPQGCSFSKRGRRSRSSFCYASVF